jgi:hypothetical protein
VGIRVQRPLIGLLISKENHWPHEMLSDVRQQEALSIVVPRMVSSARKTGTETWNTRVEELISLPSGLSVVRSAGNPHGPPNEEHVRWLNLTAQVWICFTSTFIERVVENRPFQSLEHGL